MRSFFRTSMLLLAAAGFGLAQSAAAAKALASLPTCALPCLVIAIQASPCGLANTTCQCTNVQLQTSATTCIVGSCSVVDALSAKNITQTMCGAEVRDKSQEATIISIVVMSIAFAVVIIRFASKIFTSSEVGRDDWAILAAMIVALPSAILNVVGLNANGLGRDIWTLTPAMITKFAMSFYIVSILYFAALPLLKLSLLFFYIRIFPARNIRNLLWGTVVFNCLFGVAFVLTAIFQCTPISYNWTNWMAEGGGTCVNINAVAWANAGVSIAVDLWMLALPFSQLKNLKMHWKKKIGVALMFCVGTFVTIVSAIRLVSLVQFRASDNLSWDYWSISIWSSVEITIGIICTSMPAMRVLLVRMAPKFFGSGTRTFRSDYYMKSGSGGKSNGKGGSNFSRGQNSWKQGSSNKPTVNDTEISRAGMESPEQALFPRGASDVELVSHGGNFDAHDDDVSRPEQHRRDITVSTQISVRKHDPPAPSPFDKYQAERSWSR